MPKYTLKQKVNTKRWICQQVFNKNAKGLFFLTCSKQQATRFKKRFLIYKIIKCFVFKTTDGSHHAHSHPLKGSSYGSHQVWFLKTHPEDISSDQRRTAALKAAQAQALCVLLRTRSLRWNCFSHADLLQGSVKTFTVIQRAISPGFCSIRYKPEEF